MAARGNGSRNHSPSEFPGRQQCLPRTSGPTNSPLPDDDGEFHNSRSDESPHVNAVSSDGRGTNPSSLPVSAHPERPLAISSGLRRNGQLRKRAFAPRSTTGCMTCRRRKKRCDERKPECHNCSKAAYVCEGYWPPKPFTGSKRPSASKQEPPMPYSVPVPINNLPACGATLPQYRPQNNQNEYFTAIEAAPDPAWTYNTANGYQYYNTAAAGGNGGSFAMGNSSTTNTGATPLFPEPVANHAFPNNKSGSDVAATISQGPQLACFSTEEMLCEIMLRLRREKGNSSDGSNYIL